MPASVYLEEKTDEQKKEEVRLSKKTLDRKMSSFDFSRCYILEYNKAQYSSYISNHMVVVVMVHSSPCCVSQLLTAMVAKLGNMDEPLPQDSFEGVDEDEWVSVLWG